MGNSWSFKPNDKYKSTHRLIQLLVDIVSKGGNFLLNVGPQPDGRLPEEALVRMKQIGDWMNVNSEAIYGTRPIAPYKEDGVAFTRKGRSVYAIYLTRNEGDNLPGQVAFSHLQPAAGSKMHLLGIVNPLHWQTDASGKTVVDIPLSAQTSPPCHDAFVMKFTMAGNGEVKD